MWKTKVATIGGKIALNQRKKCRDSGPDAGEVSGSSEFGKINCFLLHECGYVDHVTKPIVEMPIHPLEGRDNNSLLRRRHMKLKTPDLLPDSTLHNTPGHFRMFPGLA